MAHIHLSDADRLRLAVAVSVLRSKPKDFSVSAYVFHLRTKLPPSGPAPPTADYCWKTYALQLEQDLEHLREIFNAQRAELLAVRMSTDIVPEITSSIASSIPHKGSDITLANTNKKKTKAKKAPGSPDVRAAPSQYYPRLGLQNTTQGLQEKIAVDFPHNSQLLYALGALEKAHSDKATLLHATLHTLQTVARMLAPALGPPTAKAASHTTISTLGRVLHHTTIISLRSTALQELDVAERLELSAVDKIFDCMIDDIFVPVIRAFKRVSMSFLSSLLGDTSIFHNSREAEKSPHDPHLVDLRPALLGLFQTLVDGLRIVFSSQSSNRKGGQYHALISRRAISLSSLKAALILEVIREVERILFSTSHKEVSGTQYTNSEPGSDGTSINSPVGSGSAVPGIVDLQDRMKRLIAKDALWYLCSLMHILAGLPIPQGLELPSGIITQTDSGPAPFSSSSEDGFTNNANGTMFLRLLHETILSALYDLVLKCQPAVSQLQKDTDPLLGIGFRHLTRGPQPIDNEHHSFDVVRNHDHKQGVSDSQPMTSKYKAHVLKADVSLANGHGEALYDSQAQGQSSAIIAHESEVGDPGGRDEITLQDNNNASAMSDGVYYCQTGAGEEVGVVANQGEQMREISNSKDGALSVTKPKLGVYSSDVAGSATGCLIDEAGFSMLLGVVERYILDPEYV